MDCLINICYLSLKRHQIVCVRRVCPSWAHRLGNLRGPPDNTSHFRQSRGWEKRTIQAHVRVQVSSCLIHAGSAAPFSPLTVHTISLVSK